MTELLEWLAAHPGISVAGAVLAVLVPSYLTYQRLSLERRRHRHSRLEKGEEMLAGPSIQERISGIFELRQLAIDHPADSHVIVMRTLSAYLREHMRLATKPDVGVVADLDTVDRRVATEVMKAIGSRGRRGLRAERKESYTIDLRGLDLRTLQLPSCNFSKVDASGSYFSQARLDGSSFRGARLLGTYFNGAQLQRVDMSEAQLDHADMRGADLADGSLSDAQMNWTDMPRSLFGTDLSGAYLFEVRGLDQQTLDSARQRLGKPPSILRSSDAESGALLVWNGGEISKVMSGRRRTTFFARLSRVNRHPRTRTERTAQLKDGSSCFLESYRLAPWRRRLYDVSRSFMQGEHSEHTVVHRSASRKDALVAFERQVDEVNGRSRSS